MNWQATLCSYRVYSHYLLASNGCSRNDYTAGGTYRFQNGLAITGTGTAARPWGFLRCVHLRCDGLLNPPAQAG